MNDEATVASPVLFGQWTLKDCLRIARRMCYWDGIRPEDGEDFAQEVVLEMISRARSNGGDLSKKEMWRAARCVRNRYRRAYAKGCLSLNAPIQDTEEPIELWETLADKDNDLDAWLDAGTRLRELPPGVLRIARKLEKGDPLTRWQKLYLARFRQDRGLKAKLVWATKLYYYRRSKGLCINCGEENDNGFARCARCLEKFRAHQATYRRRKGAAWQRTLRKHWRKQGRCPRCGGVPEPGRKKCSCCLAKDREHNRRWKAARKAEG